MRNSRYFSIILISLLHQISIAEMGFTKFSLTRYFAEHSIAEGWDQYQRLDEPQDSVLTVTAMPAFSSVLDHGYPRPTVMIQGLNDTLVLRVQFINRNPTLYKWEEKAPELWVAPRLFGINSNFREDTPAIDSTDLSYGVRFWQYRSRDVSFPDSFLANDNGWFLYMNVWDIPLGQWVLSANLTENAPNDIEFLVVGAEFTLIEAKDGQDSINALLGCGERAFFDRNYVDAAKWAEEALDDYPNSGPAWWNRALYYMYAGDSILTVQSFDSAKKYYSASLDPRLPDTTKTVAPVERLYMRFALPEIEANKESYLSKDSIFRNH